MTVPRADQDSPWKDVLRTYFPQAMQFFFPNTAALVDWERPYEFLDKELLQITRDAQCGRRYADQLFRLTKMLYEKGFERQRVLDLYRFIDWLIILPEASEREFWQELLTAIPNSKS